MALTGSWKVDRSDNYDKFMEKMGINIVKRKLAAHDNLKLIITQDGNKFTVKESSTFRTIEIVFDLGVNFNYSLADGTELSDREMERRGNDKRGREKDRHLQTCLTACEATPLQGTWNLEGDKLVGKFTRVDNGKELNAVREVVGDEMVQTYVYEGVEAKRFFKRD